jgi:hypothetical protein
MVLSGLPVSASRALLQRHLRRAAVALAAVLAGVGLAACGGSSNTTANAQKLLSQTFKANFAKIHSGVLSLSISADLAGLKSLGGRPISLQLSGPFNETAGTVTAFDFGATATVDASTLPVGIISTGKALYVEVAGTYYSLPASIASSIARSVHSTGATSSSSLLAQLGINPLSWLTAPTLVGTKMVGGVDTDHLTAQLDVRELLNDVAKLASGTSGITGASLSKELTPSNLDQLASTVSSAHVEVYTGASDHILREFAVAVRFSIPLIGQSSLGGLTGGSLDLDLTITNLNAPETITAPSSSEPFSDLLGSSGALGSL